MLRALCLACLLVLPAASGAAPLRVAILTAELDRAGPGLLLRDIARGDAQVAALARLIARADPDILVLLRIDHDLTGLALAAFADAVATAGTALPHRFALRPNSGMATGLDMDGDGRLRGARDRQGYGRFSGQNGMAVLSKHPVETGRARDFSALLWRDLPGATLPVHPDGTPFPSAAAQAVQRLFATGAWEVPVTLPGGGRLNLLVFHATPPVFDGPEDRNGLRNRDELRFWSLLLDGALDQPPPAAPFVLAGNANLDPARGDGRRAAIRALLARPDLQDPAPTSPGAAAAGDPRDTVAWDAEGEPGNMRVDYLLPAAGLRVTGSGVLWPAPGEAARALLGADGRAASRHRLVWVDLDLP